MPAAVLCALHCAYALHNIRHPDGPSCGHSRDVSLSCPCSSLLFPVNGRGQFLISTIDLGTSSEDIEAEKIAHGGGATVEVAEHVLKSRARGFLSIG